MIIPCSAVLVATAMAAILLVERHQSEPLEESTPASASADQPRELRENSNRSESRDSQLPDAPDESPPLEPGPLDRLRAHFEEHAVLGLARIWAAEIELYRLLDREGGPGEYWVADVSGLARIALGKDKPPLALLSGEVGWADARPFVPINETVIVVGSEDSRTIVLWALPLSLRSRNGHWYEYRSLIPVPNPQDSPGGTRTAAGMLDGAGLAFVATPLSYPRSGRQTYLVKLDGVVYGKDTAGSVPSGIPEDPAADGWAPILDAADTRPIRLPK